MEKQFRGDRRDLLYIPELLLQREGKMDFVKLREDGTLQQAQRKTRFWEEPAQSHERLVLIIHLAPNSSGNYILAFSFTYMVYMVVLEFRLDLKAS